MRAWVDLTLMVLTFILSIVWNIEVGVVVSLVISLLMVVHRSSRTRMTILVWSDVTLLSIVTSLNFFHRAVFPVPIDGNQSKKILRQRKVWRGLSLSEFGKISILVGRLIILLIIYLMLTLCVANTAQLKGLCY